ncbi:MAG TPA: toll/interleukin-1 receptor domain-containing protein [Allosphingosinicella sp.]|nr:toll/interleukin-1 receptor domain-containing protein [Allosphingosinicella sp.]
MGERAADGLRYTAFLSYSHKDAAAALRLHRRLETYRMPRRLVGTETARGPVPERLAPIFRDREELPAASDLSETVREALARSGALIILCSPAAAESLWVAEEIRVFRELHPDRPILAAVLDGDPPDCFPAALRAFGQDGTWHEPLATDLRPHRDGSRLGLLKLVAGITGVGLDALVQRDAARRIRRVMAVTVGAVIAMLIMAALALVAVNARREAERERGETARQVEFMLTDLRTRLKGVGRLDIMQAVNRHVLDYYSRQGALSTLPANALLRRARILHAIGEDDFNQGNFASALAAFRQAHRTTAEQLARSPDDPERIWTHGQSEFWIAEIFRAQLNWPEAQSHYEAYADSGRRLIGIDGRNPDYMMEAGWGALNLGIVQLRGYRNFAAARASFATAVSWFDRSAEARPGDENVQGEQANAQAWLADTFLASGDYPRSLAARRRQLALRSQLQQADPGNMQRLYDLANAERAVGRNESILHRRTAAMPHFESAYARALALVRHDSRNQTWLLFKAKIECEWLLGEPGRPPALTPARLRHSIEAAAAALAANPNVREISPCLAHSRPGQPRTY